MDAVRHLFWWRGFSAGGAGAGAGGAGDAGASGAGGAGAGGAGGAASADGAAAEPGGLALMAALASDDARLQEALAHVAKVLSWEDSEGGGQPAWVRQRRDAHATRKVGAPRRGPPSLCDEMGGWDAEARRPGAQTAGEQTAAG